MFTQEKNQAIAEIPIDQWQKRKAGKNFERLPEQYF
jgi:hypothetical protein